MNVRPIGLLAAIVVLLFNHAIADQVDGQAGCYPALRPNDSAYPDAMNLARALAKHGFTVKCIAPSKMTGAFEGQLGAALYRTERGDFEALFLPNPNNFDGLQIVRRQASGRYLYSFGGHPKPWPTNLIEAYRPVYFLKNRNRLIVTSDKQLFTRLATTLVGR